jgi:hypothetical protein
MTTAPSFSEIAAAVVFTLALIHTLSVNQIAHAGRHCAPGSAKESLCGFLAEAEIVFGLWAGVLLILLCFADGPTGAIRYAESLDFKEALFVFVIMTVAATRPVVDMARSLIFGSAKVVPFQPDIPVYLASLVIGPLLGSFITEPAAMTVTALLLEQRYFRARVSNRFKYLTLATLFVNVSIGGVLTPFAAPPVLMVATQWGWGLGYMLANLGWKAACAVALNAAVAAWVLRKELRDLKITQPSQSESIPGWIGGSHLIFLALIVATSHHPVIFIGLFLFFLGFTAVTRSHQDALKLRESLLVAFFLGGLVVLGGLQRWWLEPLIRDLGKVSLYLGTSALTAITDNAALTYLGSRIDGFPESLRQALVAGAVAGGGLTVIANAPNPAGQSILKESFGEEGIGVGKLFVHALIPTLIALIFLWP